MASPDETDAKSVPHKRGRKAYMVETMRCLMFARDNLPGEVYDEFVKTMTEIWKQRADPDGEIRSICAENCIETAVKLFQDWAPVKQGFLNFTQGRILFDGDDSVDANAGVDIWTQIQSPLDFLQRAKTCPDFSDDDYASMLQALSKFSRRTMTIQEVFHIMKECMSHCPELLEEFTNDYLPTDLKALLAEEKSCRNPKIGRVGKAALCFTPDANHSLDGAQIKATKTRRDGNEVSAHAEEDEEENVEPLPDWSPSRLGELPPEVNPKKCKPCTPSYYVLPLNCITQSSYRTRLGRSIINDTLVCSTSGSEGCKSKSENESSETEVPDSSKHKCKKENSAIFTCEEDMFESDMLLEWFTVTADFIASLQDRIGSIMNVAEQLTPLHRRCIIKLYGEDFLDALLDSPNASGVLPVILSRLNQKIEEIREARLRLHNTCSGVIAKNYYRSLDHRGSSFKQLDAKRMTQKALLAEAKEIIRKRQNTADEYANPDMHKDISSIISSVCSSEEKQVTTWIKIVHPFLSAHCLWRSLEETVVPEKVCEHCGTNKDFLAFLAMLPLSSKFQRDEFLRTSSNECSSSHDGFGEDTEEGEFLRDEETTKSKPMFGPRKNQASCEVAASAGDGWSSRRLSADTSRPSNRDHWNEPENRHESRQQYKRITKPCGVRGGPCCSLVILLRLYQILYERLKTARDLCTNDLYAEFKEKLVKLIHHSIDNCNFEDFCLKFLGPMSFKLFTLDIVINRVIKQISIISSSDQDNSLVQFLENLRRPILPKILSQHKNFPNNQSDGLPKHDGEQPGKALDDTGKLKARHFERRKKRKLENEAVSSPRLGEGTETQS